LKEEDRKDEVTKVNEEERSSEEEVIRRMMMTTEKVLPFSLLPLSHPHYLSPSFLSVILTTSLPPSSQSSSPPLHLSFLSIRHLITSLLFPVILSSTSLPLSFFRLHPPY
jgi:hypothetical protein